MTFTLENSFWPHWRAAGAVLGLVGGGLCALLGSLLTALSWLVREPQGKQLVHTLGGDMLCLTIPLLLLGGVCLDWWEKGAPTSRSKVGQTNDHG
jgi:hypothetical protein